MLWVAKHRLADLVPASVHQQHEALMSLSDSLHVQACFCTALYTLLCQEDDKVTVFVPSVVRRPAYDGVVYTWNLQQAIVCFDPRCISGSDSRCISRLV